MMYLSIKKRLLMALTAIAFSSSVFSADIARTLRTNADENSEPENFFEIGMGAGMAIGTSFTDEDGKVAGLNVQLSGSYNWNGFFVDILGETSENILLGYNAYNHKNWSFDVVLGATGNGLLDDTDERFENINDRESSSMLGARATGYYGDNIIQLSLKHDISNTSKGTVASALIGHNWQYRNWNFHGLAGIYLADAQFNDYYIGVSEEEANRTNFTAYDGKATLTFNSSFGMTYPISENWVYRATVYAGTGIGLNDSPLYLKRRNFSVGINTSISYVF